MLNCNQCGHPNADSSRFCEVCGAPLVKVQVESSVNNAEVCVNCGNPVGKGDVFCEHCGWKYGDVIPEQVTESDIRKWNNIPEEPVHQKKKVNIVIPIVIGISVLLIVGILVLFFMVIRPMILDKTDEVFQQNVVDEEGLENILGRQDGLEGQDVAGTVATVVPTATPTPTEPPFDPNSVTHAFIDTTMVNRYDYAKVGIAFATQTSEYIQSGSTNGADMAVDGDEVTSWQEGVVGDGIGEGVTYQFDRQYDIKYFSFKLGNWRNDKYFIGNNRPKSLTVTLDGRAFVFDFPADKQEYFIELSDDFPASSVSITINSVYDGASWEDTCIAEIGIFGR